MHFPASKTAWLFGFSESSGVSSLLPIALSFGTIRYIKLALEVALLIDAKAGKVLVQK